MNRHDMFALCPFYDGASGKNLRCTGVNHISGVTIRFDGRIPMLSYKIDHCDSDYKSCIWYKRLQELYNEGSKR